MAVTVGDLVRSGPALARVDDGHGRHDGGRGDDGDSDVGDDAPVTWVHSSDLLDPSPFLDRGHLLLTTGAQLVGRTGPEVRAYVDRLVGVGVSALGFGIEVVRPDVPPALASACARAGLPLVEVPYATPFIAIARWVAEALAADAHARDAWALEAQRAISLAALSRGRTTAVLDELARRLGAEVVLHDAHGDPVSRHGATAGSADAAAERRAAVAQEAARLLRRRLRAGSSVDAGEVRTVLQTLGRRHELRGVLAVATTGRLDAAATGVLTSAAALTEFALEDVGRRRSGERAVRGQLLALLLAGRQDLVAQVVGPDQLPVPPLRVLLADAERAAAADAEAGLDAVAADGTAVFVGPHERWLAVVVAEPAARVLDVLERAGVAVGVSRRTDYPNLASALVQARGALLQAGGAARTVFADTEGDLVLGILPRGEIAELARVRLAAVVADPDGADLLHTLEVWLRHNALWEPAARELGVHRHTVKAKVRRVELLLGLPLDTFAGKAQVWMMLMAR